MSEIETSNDLETNAAFKGQAGRSTKAWSSDNT